MATAPPIRILPCVDADAAAMATCWFDAFTTGTHPQTAYYARMFPRTPRVHDFFRASLAAQMQQEPRSRFLKAVDGDRLIGFVKYGAPGGGEAAWADLAPESDEALCAHFFGVMAENREALMGARPHWYIELMGVDQAYARRGIGAMLLEAGCKLADAEGLGCYVDASPVARPLYERFGFVERNTCRMPGEFGWYEESFMVRPAK